MNAVKDILNSIRSKMKPRVIISLSLVCVLIFPAILIENSSIPTSDSNMYLLSCPNGVGDTFIGFSNLSSSPPQTYYLLNNRLDKKKLEEKKFDPIKPIMEKIKGFLRNKIS